MFWRTLVLTVLWLEAFAETIVKITEKDSIYNTTFDTSQGSIELRIDKRTLEDVRHGYLVIYPISDHSYEIRAGNKGEEKLRCIGNHHSVCVLSLDEEEHHIKSIKGFGIEMTMNCVSDCKGALGVAVSQHMYSNHIGSTNIVLDGVPNLKMELSLALNSSASKLRFHAGGYSKDHDLHSLSLTCYGNAKKDEWPSSQTHDFELKHIHGNELSHVIYSRDSFFCKSREKCKYKFTCNTLNIYRIVFYALEAEKIEPLTEYESYVV